MRSDYRPVQLHASVHDDEPCMCLSCTDLLGRLTLNATRSQSLLLHQRSLQASQTLFVDPKI